MGKKSFTEIESYFQENNIQKYRLKQFNKAFFQNFKNSFEEMTEFPQDLRKSLSDEISLRSLTIAKELIGKDSSKIAFQTEDGYIIETVLIRSEKRITICLSSQVGCPVKCLFCATGQLGFKRNLTTDEIIEQFLYFANQLIKHNKKITNVVFMGMGEPLLNYDNVMQALEILADPEKIGLGKRSITISTVGILAPLKKLLSQKNQFKIAISLHASNQGIRDKIIPISPKNGISELLALTAEYAKTSNKRTTYEYILLKGINDSVANAEELADRFKELKNLTFINLIAYNPVAHAQFERSSNNAAYRFLEVLKGHGIPAFIRFSEGQEIDGACGQLAGEIDKN